MTKCWVQKDPVLVKVYVCRHVGGESGAAPQLWDPGARSFLLVPDSLQQTGFAFIRNNRKRQ